MGKSAVYPITNAHIVMTMHDEEKSSLVSIAFYPFIFILPRKQVPQLQFVHSASSDFCCRESEGEFAYGNYWKEVEDLRAVIEYWRSQGREITAIIGHSKGFAFF